MYTRIGQIGTSGLVCAAVELAVTRLRAGLPRSGRLRTRRALSPPDWIDEISFGRPGPSLADSLPIAQALSFYAPRRVSSGVGFEKMTKSALALAREVHRVSSSEPSSHV